MKFLEAIKEWAPIGVLIGAMIYGFITQLLKRKKKHPTIDNDVKFSVPIYDILTDLLFKYPATRTFIKQFHNGNEFYSGQKIQRLSISHERCRPGVNPLKPYHDNVQVTTEVHDVLNRMDEMHKEWFWCSDLDAAQHFSVELFRWMKSYGTVSILYLRLLDKKNGETIGLLGLTFNHKFKLDEVDDILDMIKKKKEIETEFNKV